MKKTMKRMLRTPPTPKKHGIIGCYFGELLLQVKPEIRNFKIIFNLTVDAGVGSFTGKRFCSEGVRVGLSKKKLSSVRQLFFNL